MYNFKKKEYHRLSAGFGLGFNFDDVHFCSFPLQLEIFPLDNLKRLSLIMEVAPCLRGGTYINLDVRHLWGFRYTFNSKSKNQ